MASVTVKIEGLQQLGEALKGMGTDMQKKIARAATAAAAREIRKRAVANAPRSDEPHFYTPTDKGAKGITKGQKVEIQPGNLKKSITIRRTSPSKTPLTSEHVVFVRGRRKDGYAARYARLVEFGSTKHAAKPFMRPAFDNGAQPAADAMKTALAKGIAKANKP